MPEKLKPYTLQVGRKYFEFEKVKEQLLKKSQEDAAAMCLTACGPFGSFVGKTLCTGRANVLGKISVLKFLCFQLGYVPVTFELVRFTTCKTF